MNYFKTFAEVYTKLSKDLLFSGETHSPRNSKTKELRNYVYTITNPYSNLYENQKRSVPKKYLANELIWYFSGSNDVNFISKNAKLWNKLKNPDGKTVNSAYGHLLFNDKNEYGITEWDWAKQNLIDDINTRQGLIRFNKPKHSWFGNRDFVCTLNGIFLVRNNKLHLTILQRSCDIMTGLTYDVPFFLLLMQLMRLELQNEGVNVELGTFTHHIVSLHIYEKDEEKLEEMLEYGIFSDKLPEIKTPYIREILNGIIKDGIIKSNDYNNIKQAVLSDSFLEWCFTNSKLENL